ncbi:MAG TPA: hypothetical protein VFU15_02455 [Bacteroidia bacterium]|nr:hypothetical protein [Bacteroidia bacterium]
MKRFFYAAAVLMSISWMACSGNKPDAQEPPLPQGMKSIHLDHLGFPLNIYIPDSTYYPTVDTSEVPGGAEIKIGSHFDILVNTAGAEESDITKMKSVIEAGDELPKTFTVTDSTTLVWSTNLGDLSMFHFFMIRKVGKDTYYVRDNMDNPDNQFKKEEIDKMMETAKTLHADPRFAPKS